MVAFIRNILKQKSQVAKILVIVCLTLIICVKLSSKWNSAEEYDFNYLDKTPRVGEEIVIKPGLRLTTKAPRFASFLHSMNPIARVLHEDLPVIRADTASSGAPWPIPHAMLEEHKVLLVQGKQLEFVIRGKTCGILERALKRHKKLFQQFFVSTTPSSDEKSDAVQKSRMLSVFTNVDIVLLEDCAEYPSADMDETYELILSNESKLEANQVWGILHGLETLHQLVHRSANYSTPTTDSFVVPHVTIEDKPRYSHRGILIDSSRHFLKKETILTNLDAMSQVKFNVLHWHLVDDQSFPFESKIFPNLTLKGAYKDIRGNPIYYTQEDIKEIIDFARDRGIRIMPEFDTPGHMESWQGGLPEILTECSARRISKRPGPLNPIKEITYIKLKLLFQEIIRLFPEKYLHLGGDECSYFCWSESREIADFMSKNNMLKYEDLFQYYETRLTKMLHEIDPSTVPVVWQEVYDEGTQLPPNAIIQFWKSDLFSLPFKNVSRAGHKIIFSSCWYLNYVKYGTDWQTYYVCDPGVFAREDSDVILGGEACMWGEFVDDTNLFQYLWPRAIGVAERLWTPPEKINVFEANARFEEQRCRFIRRGIPAAPHLGPGAPCT